MEKLTKFQKRCEKNLASALSSVGKRIQKRSLGGYNEVYIHAYITDSDIEIWIYEDEAMIGGQGIDIRFEGPDFDSTDELMYNFINKVVSLCK